jgi:hypothetical protein
MGSLSKAWWRRRRIGRDRRRLLCLVGAAPSFPTLPVDDRAMPTAPLVHAAIEVWLDPSFGHVGTSAPVAVPTRDTPRTAGGLSAARPFEGSPTIPSEVPATGGETTRFPAVLSSLLLSLAAAGASGCSAVPAGQEPVPESPPSRVGAG